MLFLVRLLGVVVLMCVLGTLRAESSEGAERKSDAMANRDTIYSLDHAYSLAGKNDSFVWQILDSIDRREASAVSRGVPAYEIELAQAFVASRDLNPRRAIRYLRPLLASEELNDHPKKHLFALALMCNECEVMNRTDEQYEYTLQYMELARQSGDSVRYACAQLYLALAYQAQKAYEKAYPCLRRAQSMLERTDDPRALSYGLWSLEIEAELAADRQNYAEAIHLTRQLILRYDRLSAQQRKQAGVEKKEDMNRRQAQNLISLARLYMYDIQPVNAQKSYKEARSLLDGTPPVLSPQLNELTFDYLKAAGRYQEALACARRYAEETSVGDTLNRFHLEAKRQLAEMYRLLGDYRNAWLYEHQVRELTDSLQERSNREAALEMQTAYETAQQELRIQHQQTVIARNRHIMLLLSIGLLSLAALLWVIGSSSRRIVRKNRKLFEQIARLSHARKELERIRSAMNDRKAKRNTPEAKGLFDSLEKLMNERKVFRHPDLNRNQVAAQLGTNKLYLSNAIAERCSMTFSEYLNQCRLEYAKEVLLSDYTTKIEAIALMSGFNSVRTFYRLFQKHYQLTPSEFRRLSELMNHDH